MEKYTDSNHHNLDPCIMLGPLNRRVEEGCLVGWLDGLMDGWMD
jgi:hypothetical protein